MRKVWIWIKISLFLPYFIFLAYRVKNKTFEERFFAGKKMSKIVLQMANVNVEVSGLVHIQKQETYLFVGNHQGSLDPFLLLYALPYPSSAVAKKELERMPFINTWFSLLEGIGFDRTSLRDGARMIKMVNERLLSGQSIVIFPEGTRSNSNQTLPFKAGAIKSAYVTKTKICPFALVNAHTIIDQGKRKVVHVHFFESISNEEFEDNQAQNFVVELQEQIQMFITSTERESI